MTWDKGILLKVLGGSIKGSWECEGFEGNVNVRILRGFGGVRGEGRGGVACRGPNTVINS